jgi:ATP-binding cassette subfamily B protein
MTTALQRWGWPRERIGESVVALARVAGIVTRASEPAGDALGSADVAGRAQRVGLEAEAVDVTYAELERFARSAGPALVRLADGSAIAVVRHRRGKLLVVGPDGVTGTIDARIVRDALCRPLEASIASDVDAVLDAARVPEARRARARWTLLRERLALSRIEAGWIVRPAPGAAVAMHVRSSHFAGRIGLLAVTHVAAYGLGILGWWMIAKGALEGRLDRGWLLAWALVLFTQLPLRTIAMRVQGRLAIDAGALLKQRLLAGALRLAPDAIRAEGAGKLLGRIFESEAVESLALDAGFVGLTAILELAVAAAILALGAAGIVHVVLLAAWLALTLAIAWRYFARRTAWTAERLAITHDLVERMLGHRTRLAQQPSRLWHEGEDDALEGYLEASMRMDTHGARLAALLPRGWVVVAIVGLLPWFVTGSASTAALATAIGGTLLAYRAMQKIVVGVASITGARIAWRTVAPLFHAAAAKSGPVAPELAPASGEREPRDPATPILDGNEIVFRYRDRGEPVLRGCSVRIHPGDRILVEGSSGGGKSTFGSVLTGMREPESGLLLVDGLDLKTLGLERWRRRVAGAPQFHENHVLSATFAFNLLMGRRWPPRPDDLALAETICHELELGPLLARMPAGLMQMVGETGWQLSHGEKSRLFVARALLQGADVMVLDESFAALDPQTLERSLACVMARANALVVIAHP